ncbi:MAG: hypothetical protein SPH96_06895 [Agathobacter sp.]|nr:hypothetical protein [Agathobacter sp.]
MKKILAIIVVIVVIAVVAMLGIGLGFGKGSGDGSGDGKTNTSQEAINTEEHNMVEEQTEVEQDDAGNDSEGTIIKVSVVGNEYFYENERVSLDDFISKLEMLEGEVVVEVKDDKASLRAYNNLIEKLEELKISFTEK